MDTVNVISAGAMKPALVDLAPAFGGAQGCQVTLVFGPAPEVNRRVTQDGGFDVVIGPSRLLDALAEEGLIEEASRVALGGVKAAIALHRDAPGPDISSAGAVRDAIEVAGAVVYNSGSSGQFIDSMIKDLGIADEVEPKVKRLADGEAVMNFLASEEGKTAIAFGQSSAIRGYEKSLPVRLAGALPDAIGNVTAYEGAVAATSANADLARAFLGYLIDSDGRRTLLACGIQ